MWRFREGAEGVGRTEHARRMKERLEALRGIVPEIVELEVGVNVNPSDAAYDAVLVSLFRSAADLDAYKRHPAHVAVSDWCKSVRESRVAVDYEV